MTPAAAARQRCAHPRFGILGGCVEVACEELDALGGVEEAGGRILGDMPTGSGGQAGRKVEVGDGDGEGRGEGKVEQEKVWLRVDDWGDVVGGQEAQVGK